MTEACSTCPEQQMAAALTWVEADQRCEPGGTECTRTAANSTWVQERQYSDKPTNPSGIIKTYFHFSKNWNHDSSHYSCFSPCVKPADTSLKVPLLDHGADCSCDVFSKQPGLPTLCPHWRVTSEKGLQGGCLVPAHQQLRLRVLKKPTDIGWNKERKSSTLQYWS